MLSLNRVGFDMWIMQLIKALNAPFLLMVVVQLLSSGMQISNKVALNNGLNPFVLVFYRQIFATLSIAPFAYFIEWKNLPPITRPIVGYLALCAFFGIVGNQCLYLFGLKYTSPTIATAIGNLLPGFTYVMNIIFRQAKFDYTTRSGVAKIGGTVVAIGGAMITVVYKGMPIVYPSGVLWPQLLQSTFRQDKESWIGPMLVIGSCISTAAWFTLMGRMKNTFDRPITTTAVTGFFGVFLTGLIAASAEHHGDGWSLSSAYRWVPAVYSGVIGSALAFYLMSVCIKAKGGLYVSMFTPMMLLLVVILRFLLQNELIFLGHLLGAVLILLGFSSVQWGLWREQRTLKEEEERQRMEEARGPELL